MTLVTLRRHDAPCIAVISHNSDAYKTTSKFTHRLLKTTINNLDISPSRPFSFPSHVPNFAMASSEQPAPRLCSKWADCSCASSGSPCGCGDSCGCGSVCWEDVDRAKETQCQYSDCKCGIMCACGKDNCSW